MAREVLLGPATNEEVRIEYPVSEEDNIDWLDELASQEHLLAIPLVYGAVGIKTLKRKAINPSYLSTHSRNCSLWKANHSMTSEKSSFLISKHVPTLSYNRAGYSLALAQRLSASRLLKEPYKQKESFQSSFWLTQAASIGLGIIGIKLVVEDESEEKEKEAEKDAMYEKGTDQEPSYSRPIKPRLYSSLEQLQSDLPSILYDHQALLAVLDEIPMSLQVKGKAILYLENIQEKVNEIKRYQSSKYPEHFYHAMKEAILEIQNTARTLYELTKPCHQTLSNSLRNVILQSIASFEKELNKRLEMTTAEKEALRLKTKRLYAEQSYIARQEELRKSLMEHLGKVKQLLMETGKPSPCCYISYAWPSKENYEQEYWVQPFLSIFYDHLTAAGIRMIMDIRDNKPGNSIYKFMEQYHDGNYIILVGTESLLQKHYGVVSHAVQTELSIIYNRFEEDQKQFGYSRICPLLISGSMRSSFPEIYDKYRTVRDAREMGSYVVMLRRLLDWMYEQQIGKVEAEYKKLWRDFDEHYSGLSKEADAKAIEQELSRGYHRQRLDYLKQDL